MLRCLLLVTLLGLAACGEAERASAGGDRETRRIVDVVTRAISHPRQQTAMDYARAAAATPAGQDGRITVVGVRDLEAEELEDPLGELVLRVRYARGGYKGEQVVTACYTALFSRYGVTGEPRELRCDEDAAPVDIPAAPPPAPEPTVPAGADEVVRAQLQSAAARPEARAIRTALTAALPAPKGSLPPEVDVRLDGADIGVALRGAGACVLGVRHAGKVEVWRPSRIQVAPGELSCDATTALGRLAQRPPH